MGETVSCSWREAAERYQVHVLAHHAESTRKVVLGILDDFGVFFGADRAVADLSIEILDQYQLRRRRGTRKCEVSEAQTNKLCRHLLAFVRWAIDRRLLLHDPTIGFRYLRQVKRRMETKTAGEIERLLGVLRARGDRDVEDWLWVGGNCGARYSEVMAVRVRDVDFEKRRLRLANYGRHLNKDREDREVPMNDVMAAVLGRRVMPVAKDPDALLFVGARRHWAMWKALKAAAFDAGIGYCTFQVIRRSFATMATAWYTPWQLQQLLGHSDIAVTMAHYIDAEKLRIGAPPNIGPAALAAKA